MRDKSRRRWFQFSLRTFLVFCLGLGLGLGWLGMRLRRAHEQRWIVTQLASTGGTVYYDYQVGGNVIVPQKAPPAPAILRAVFGVDFFANVECALWNRPPGPSERELELLQRLPTLRDVRLCGSNVTDAGLVHVARVPQLRGVNLTDLAITPDGLAQLGVSPTLTTLSLHGSWIADAHLERLKEFPALTHLQLLRVPGTDEGMRSIGSLTALRSLDLIEAPRITDTGFRYLVTLQCLESLQLVATGVRDDGLNSLREFPRLKYLGVTVSGIRGMEHVGDLSGLQRLKLWGISLDRAGLLKLHRLTSLEGLDLGTLSAEVTPEDVQTLRQKLPHCRVVGWDSSSNKPFDYAPAEE